MHSSLVRLQNTFGYFTTVAFALGAAIALSSLVSTQNPSASLALRNVQVVKGRPHYYSTKKEEYAHVKFDLDADLSSLFSWNTKQVFVYVTATFPSQTRKGVSKSLPPSEAIIWDAIIPSAHSPWHFNTYIHPGTTSNTKRARDRKVRSSKDRSSASKDTPLPYPIGTTEGIIKLSNQKPKYQITTPVGKIAGLENCTLHLRYNIQPWVGALVWSDWPASKEGKTGLLTPFWESLRGSKSKVFAMPGLKGKVETKEELSTEKGAEAHRLMAG